MEREEVSIRYQGAPEDKNRLPKELAVYELLEDLHIKYERVDHPVAPTIEACNEISDILGVSICKNLFLCNAQKTKFYLLILPGEKRFVTKEFCKQIESPRLSFAPESYMEQYLNITPGSVSILGLMNDVDNKVTLYVDRDILDYEYFGCHPCINTSSLKLKTKDIIETLLPAIHHQVHVVNL